MHSLTLILEQFLINLCTTTAKQTSSVTLRFSVATPFLAAHKKNHNMPHREVEVNEITPVLHRQLTGKEMHAPWTHIA